MIQVFVREENEGQGVLLGEFTPSDIPDLIRCFCNSATYMSVADGSGGYLCSQFVMGEKGVTFEIVVVEVEQ